MSGARVLVAACLSLLGLARSDVTYEENVAVLDPTNFDDFVKSQTYTIVEFYAPWCGHCKSLAPEWAAAAGKTRRLKPAVILAKVDADQHKELAERFDVSGYPTIKIFRSGKAEEYEGPREAKGIVKFVKEELGLSGAGALTRLKTPAEADELKAKKGATLIGLFREPTSASKIFQAFAEVASEAPHTSKTPINAAYAASYGADPVAAHLGIKTIPAVVLYQPSGMVSMPIPRKRDELTDETIQDWLDSVLDK